MNGSFVSEDLKDRRNDVVWRLRWRGGGDDWFYLYLLLEFQSTPEPFMAVRLLVYVGLLLQELIRIPGAEGRGPAAADPAYRPLQRQAPLEGAPRIFSSLFAPVPEGLRRRLPRLEYFLVDENRLSSRGAGAGRQSGLNSGPSGDEPRHQRIFPQSARDLGVLLPGE